jgi:hypothetical protein
LTASSVRTPRPVSFWSAAFSLPDSSSNISPEE